MPERLVSQITPMVITFNEAPNIERCLARLTWAHRILIVDSGSTDDTLAIVGRFPQAEVVHRVFDTFADQCNFGLSRLRSPWVLSLDADYELSEALEKEITTLEDHGLAGYQAGFIYRIYGRPLRGSLYPPRAVLYRRDRAIYENEGHGHRVRLDGKVGQLAAPIYHDDRKPLSRWLGSQQKYARNEADHLLSALRSRLGTADRLRLMGWPMPIVAFFYALIWRGCLLDGWPGWLYVLQRAAAETLIALEIVDRRLARTEAGANSAATAEKCNMTDESVEYRYGNAEAKWAESYLWPALRREIEPLLARGVTRAFDLGCGNGATTAFIAQMGLSLIGVDTSESGIAMARAAYPGCRFEIGSAYEDLSGRFGQFPLLVSLEVVEHLYEPRKFARTLLSLTEPNGTAIVSTPYHGYLKNLALALSGKLDSHFTVLWDGGHIKFFSIPTLRQLLEEAGFVDIRFTRAGRVPALAKSMLAIARRPAAASS